MRIGFLTLVFAALALPAIVSAQAFGSLTSIKGDPFSIAVSPQYPTSFSQAVITLGSGSIDLANATVVVSVAGKEIYNGAVRPVSVSLGKAGSVTKVKINVTSEGSTLSQMIAIQPQDVVLVAEPIASVPPLYPGKASTPLEGSVRVVAMAGLKDSAGKAANPSALSYIWTVDGTQIINSSGIGKSSIAVTSPLQYRSREISVAVQNSGGTLVGGATLSLMAEAPTVRIYENDPLLGIRFEHALTGSFPIAESEATLYAAPFSLSTLQGAPHIQWFLNGSAAQEGNSVTLRPTGSGKGNASLSLIASASDSATVTANLSLLFGSKASTNIFGL